MTPPHLIRRGERHRSAKLTERAVMRMRQLHYEGWTLLALAREFGITQTTAWRAIRRVTWKHVP